LLELLQLSRDANTAPLASFLLPTLHHKSTQIEDQNEAEDKSAG
jgi:hypothetical protein